jgi:hypothetical protein
MFSARARHSVAYSVWQQNGTASRTGCGNRMAQSRVQGVATEWHRVAYSVWQQNGTESRTGCGNRIAQRHVQGGNRMAQRRVQGVATECDDFQIVVLMNRVQCKKHKILRSVSSTMQTNVYSLFLKHYIF